MDDDGTDGLVDAEVWAAEIERAVLSETEEGRLIAVAFIATFGEFVSGTVRPMLRDVAAQGGEPQMLVNGLAQMLRNVADSVEFPMGVASSPRRPASADDGLSDGGVSDGAVSDGAVSDPTDPS